KPADRVLARRHPAEAVARRGARRVHGQRRPRPRSRRPQGPPGAGVRRRPRPAQRKGLAICRLPPRPRPRGTRRHRRPGGGARLVPMPTRKQKRRRDKDRRHEYEYVYVDEAGQEVEVDEPESAPAARSTKDQKPGAKAKTQSGSRWTKEPPEPS